jgi:hypothetical protein
MVLFDFGKKKKDDSEVDSITDLGITDLKAGCIFDYDMQTWEVVSLATVYFEDGRTSLEWEISSGGKSRWLSYEENDEEYITVTKKFPLGAIDGDVRSHIMEYEDPPEGIVYNGKTFWLEESGPGEYLCDGEDENDKEPFIFWEFVDEQEEELLTIEQWSETSFEAAVGKYIETSQISNILPGDKPGNE